MVNYVSASQVSLYVGGVWLDDANHIEYNQMSAKIPYFGYNDTHYRAVGQGKVMVQGALMISFRYAGYLTKAILTARKNYSLTDLKTAVKMSSVLKAIHRSDLLGAKDFVPADAFAEVIQNAASDKAGGKGFFAGMAAFGAETTQVTNEVGMLSRYLKERFWGETDKVEKILDKYHIDENLLSEAYPSVTDPRVRRGVDIIVNYDPADSMANPELVKVIEDVQFTSEGTQIDNSRAEFGGAPIMERYEFIAKNVSPLTLRGR